MSAFKDIYLDEVLRIAADLEDAGMDPDEAYTVAGEQAYHAATDRLADLADHLHDREKDERL